MLNLTEQTVHWNRCRTFLNISMHHVIYLEHLFESTKLNHTGFTYRIKYILNPKISRTRFENFT